MILNIETITEIFSMMKAYMKQSDIEDAALEYLEYLKNHGYEIHNLVDEDPDLNKAIDKIDAYSEEEEDPYNEYDYNYDDED